MRTLQRGAVGIQAQGVVGDGKALGFGDCVLAFFNFGVVELLNLAAIQAYQMVMVLPGVEFIDRLAALKMAAAQDAGLFKLGQYPVDRRQADIGAFFQQHAVDILSRQVALRIFLEDFQYLQPRQGGLESGAFEFFNIGHGGLCLASGRCARSGTAGTMARSYRYTSIHLMFDSQCRRAGWVLLVTASASLVACGSFDGASNRVAGLVTPYKMDIVQGNFVSKEQAAAIKPGMSRAQVRDILGTPLLTSIFHADRWDYVFTFKRQGVESQSRKVTVFFKGDGLERIEADPLPSEAEFAASLDSGRRSGKVPVLELSPEELKNLPLPARKPEAKPLSPLPASYPPLESNGR